MVFPRAPASLTFARVFTAVVLASACGSPQGRVSDESDANGGADSGSMGGEVASGTGGSNEGSCEGERPRSAVCLSAVTGNVVDEAGKPASDLPVTVCGPVCFRAVTAPDGSFAVELQRFVIVSEYSVQPHGSPHASTFYYPLAEPVRGGSYDAGTLRVVDLPDEGSELITKLDLDGATPPAQTATSGAVTISVSEGTVVRLSVADALNGEDGKKFRAREITSAHVSEFAPDLEGARVFALGPFEAEFMGDGEQTPQVSLSVENTEGWAAGAEVEVLALGTYLDSDWLTPAAFEPIGVGTVSGDGATIELPSDAPGNGLRHVTWLALRL